MDTPTSIRGRYGPCYVTLTPDGVYIPWTPLPIGDYLSYSWDMQKGVIALAQLEDEIFDKCVLDKAMVRQRDLLDAGVVALVVQHIWEASGFSSAEEFNQRLGETRYRLFGTGAAAVYKLIEIITIAFPYKPEEVLAMPYDVFMERLAQAESKLVALGMRQEPIELIPPGEEEGRQQERTVPKVDAKKAWEALHINTDELPTKRVPVSGTDMTAPAVDSVLNYVASKRGLRSVNEKWWDVSPILEVPEDKRYTPGVDDVPELMFAAVDNHDRANLDILRYQMVEDAKVIYADVIEELEKRRQQKKQ